MVYCQTISCFNLPAKSAQPFARVIILNDLKTPKTALFYTHSGLLIANGYRRLVVGKRGPYVEFDTEHIVHENMYVPPEQAYRFNGDWPDIVFYFEYRSSDVSDVMIYHQNRRVGYADYLPGCYYIAPGDLVWDDTILSED